MSYIFYIFIIFKEITFCPETSSFLDRQITFQCSGGRMWQIEGSRPDITQVERVQMYPTVASLKVPTLQIDSLSLDQTRYHPHMSMCGSTVGM